MSDRGFRLIASAIVASGGGISLALSRGDARVLVGFALVLIGGGLCLADWIASWREDQNKQSNQKSPADTRFTSQV
jgi:hypothetical protein